MTRLLAGAAALLLAIPAIAQTTPSRTSPALDAATTAPLSRNPVALQRQLAAERAKVNDLKLKLRIKASLNPFNSPLQNFFDSPEFWENPIDVAGQECANRCIKEAATHRQACALIADSARRLACYTDASNRTAQCQRTCFR